MNLSRVYPTKRGAYLGTCPSCGDSVMWYKVKGNHKRYCRCVNPACRFAGPLPRRGNLHLTGITCEFYQGLLVGVETMPTDNPADNRRYFWQSGPNPRPCVNCREHAKCRSIQRAAEGLGDEWNEVGID